VQFKMLRLMLGITDSFIHVHLTIINFMSINLSFNVSFTTELSLFNNDYKTWTFESKTRFLISSTRLPQKTFFYFTGMEQIINNI